MALFIKLLLGPMSRKSTTNGNKDTTMKNAIYLKGVKSTYIACGTDVPHSFMRNASVRFNNLYYTPE